MGYVMAFWHWYSNNVKQICLLCGRPIIHSFLPFCHVSRNVSICINPDRDSSPSRQQTAKRREEMPEGEVNAEAEEGGERRDAHVEQEQRNGAHGQVQRGEERLADVVHHEGVEGEDKEAAANERCAGPCPSHLDEVSGDTDDGDDADHDTRLMDEDVASPPLRQSIGNG